MKKLARPTLPQENSSMSFSLTTVRLRVFLFQNSLNSLKLKWSSFESLQNFVPFGSWDAK